MRPVEMTRWMLAGLVLLSGLVWTSAPVAAHCDAVDGPVAQDVKQSLADGELDRTLKWVEEGDEAEVREVFEQARRVREMGDEAATLADRHFLETVVRLHRDSEGAPYTGLLPAGTPVHPAVSAVDEALEQGSIDEVIASLQDQVEEAVQQRFEQAYAASAEAANSVEAGRKSVHAYVELVHYVKHLHELLNREPHDSVTVHAEAHEQVHSDDHAH